METERPTQQDSRQYSIQHAKYLSSRLLPFSRTDIYLLTLAGALWLYFFLAGEKLYLVLIPVVTFIAIYRVKKGRVYRVVIDFFRGKKRTLIDRGWLWQGTTAAPEIAKGKAYSLNRQRTADRSLKKVRKRLEKESSSKKRTIPLEINPLGEVALIYNRRNKTDSIVFVGDGSSFEGMDMAAQHEFVQKIARILRDVTILHPDYSLSCAWGIMKRPLDRFRFSTNLASAHHPQAIALALAERENRLEEVVANLPDYITQSLFRRLLIAGRNMLQQIDLSEKLDSEVTMFTTWTIRRESLLTSSESLAEDQVNQLAISNLADTISGELKSIGVENARALDLAGARRFLNGALNVTDIARYYEWAHRYPEAANETITETEERLAEYFDGDISALAEQLQLETSPHWPQQQIREFKDHLEIDGTFTTTLVLTEHPEYTFPNFRSILSLEFDNAFRGEGLRWYTITDIGETVSSKAQVNRMNVALPIVEHLTSNFTDMPQVRSSTEKQHEQRENIYREGYTTDSATLVTVLGSSKEQMEDYARTAEAICRRMDLGPIRLTGAARQLNACLTQLGIPLL